MIDTSSQYSWSVSCWRVVGRLTSVVLLNEQTTIYVWIRGLGSLPTTCSPTPQFQIDSPWRGNAKPEHRAGSPGHVVTMAGSNEKIIALRKEPEPSVALLPCSSGNIMIKYGEICAGFMWID